MVRMVQNELLQQYGCCADLRLTCVRGPSAVKFPTCVTTDTVTVQKSPRRKTRSSSSYTHF